MAEPLAKRALRACLPRWTAPVIRAALSEYRLARLRARVEGCRPGTVHRLFGFTIEANDGPNFYMQLKDEFIHGIYRFAASSSEPVIIDGGSNIGMSILACKRDHPSARITAFEPDPVIAAILRRNLERNRIRGVTVIEAALAGAGGSGSYLPDGSAGGRLAPEGSSTVPTTRLSEHLGGAVDFLKLNIEGMELPVLREAVDSGRLRQIREMVIEYHGWPSGDQRLGEILQLLADNGYRYLVHDFDAQTSSVTKPPFRDPGERPWFCLIHALRVGGCP